MSLFLATLLPGLFLALLGATLLWPNSLVGSTAKALPRSNRGAWLFFGAGPIEQAQRWILPIAMIALLISVAPQMWSLRGNGTLTAIGIFVLGTFVVGHLFGGRDRRDAAVLAFATSCRHPATALALASANFPDTDEHAAIALYGLVTAAIGAVYTQWLRRRRAVAG